MLSIMWFKLTNYSLVSLYLQRGWKADNVQDRKHFAIYHAYFAIYQVITLAMCNYTEEVPARQSANYQNTIRCPENERFTLPVITGSQHCINDMFPVSLQIPFCKSLLHPNSNFTVCIRNNPVFPCWFRCVQIKSEVSRKCFMPPSAITWLQRN